MLGLLHGQIFYSTDTVSVVTGETVFFSDTVELSATSTLHNAGTLIAKSQWKDNGTNDTAWKGDVEFSGSSLQEITGTGRKMYHNLIFNNSTTGLQAFVLRDSTLKIMGNATLTDGIIGNGNGHAEFLSGATVSGVSNASFFSGMVTKTGTDSFVFPIGDDTFYRPASIKNVSGSQSINAQYYLGNATGAFGIATAPGIDNVSVVEYWDITNASSADISLSWDIATSGTIGNISDLVVVGAYSSDTWHSFNGKWHQGTTTAGNVTNDSTIGDWQHFTLASLTPVNLLPTDPIVWTVQGNTNSKMAKLSWLVTQQDKFSNYKIERSTDLNQWQTLEIRPSNNEPSFQYELRDGPLKSKIYYYQLSAQSKQGDWKSYGTKKVDFRETTSHISINPNPSSSTILIEIKNSTQKSKASYSVYDVNGKLLAHKGFSGSSIRVNLDNISDGVYFVRVEANAQSKLFKLMKITR